MQSTFPNALFCRVDQGKEPASDYLQSHLHDQCLFLSLYPCFSLLHYGSASGKNVAQCYSTCPCLSSAAILQY